MNQENIRKCDCFYHTGNVWKNNCKRCGHDYTHHFHETKLWEVKEVSLYDQEEIKKFEAQLAECKTEEEKERIARRELDSKMDTKFQQQSQLMEELRILIQKHGKKASIQRWSDLANAQVAYLEEKVAVAKGAQRDHLQSGLKLFMEVRDMVRFN